MSLSVEHVCDTNEVFEAVTLPMAKRVGHVPFPRDKDTGEIVAFVHPKLQVKSL